MSKNMTEIDNENFIKFEDNLNFVKTICIIYFFSFILKKFIFYFVRRSQQINPIKDISVNKIEKCKLGQEIENLKREAEMFNNPQNYVKYVKLQRQITNLQKELENTNKEKQNENENLNIEMIPSFIQVPYFRIIFEIIFYFLHLILIYYFRNFHLIISKNNFMKNNILFNYYTIEDEIKIPVNIILILEGVFLYNSSQIFNKLFRLITQK